MRIRSIWKVTIRERGGAQSVVYEPLCAATTAQVASRAILKHMRSLGHKGVWVASVVHIGEALF